MTAGAAERPGLVPITLDVSEQIHVADAPGLVPPLFLSIQESVGVSDQVGALPPVSIAVSEQIAVADAADLAPPVVVQVDEAVRVSDLIRLVPALSIEVSEEIVVADAPGLAPPVVIDLSEQVTVLDVPSLRPEITIAVAEQIEVSDAVRVAPPAVIELSESIQARDHVVLLPEARVEVTENIAVSDALRLIPDVIIDLSENIVVRDSPDLILETDLAILIGRFRCDRPNSNIPVTIVTTPSFDATRVDHTSVRFGKNGTEAGETHVRRNSGVMQRHEVDADEDGDLDLIFHFDFEETGLSCEDTEAGLTGTTFDGAKISARGMIALGDSRVDNEPTLNVEAVNPALMPHRSAEYLVHVGDAFGGHVVAFSCQGLPSHSRCRFSPATLQVGGAGGSVRLSVVPTGSTAGGQPGGRWPPLWFMVLAALVVSGGTALRLRSSTRRPRVAWIISVVAVSALLQAACRDEPTGIEQVGPAPGTYEFLVRATSGIVTAESRAQLIVDPRVGP